jgi:23S rRNA pseudouridine1911/1915/1917 synthase
MKIIFEDNDILVLDKPTGIVVNDSETAGEGTLQAWVREQYPASSFDERNGLVHRLDKETSGVVIFAKNQAALENLQKQFKSRVVGKEYTALVFGELPDEILEINAPIGRNPKARTKMAVVADGKEAVTRVEKVKVVESNGQKMTLVKVFPKTGRTHQIRVHLAALAHPVIGDDLYAGQKRSISSREEFGRLMLHAGKISFTHPVTGKKLTFESQTPFKL